MLAWYCHWHRWLPLAINIFCSFRCAAAVLFTLIESHFLIDIIVLMADFYFEIVFPLGSDSIFRLYFLNISHHWDATFQLVLAFSWLFLGAFMPLLWIAFIILIIDISSLFRHQLHGQSPIYTYDAADFSPVQLLFVLPPFILRRCCCRCCCWLLMPGAVIFMLSAADAAFDVACADMITLIFCSLPATIRHTLIRWYRLYLLLIWYSSRCRCLYFRLIFALFRLFHIIAGQLFRFIAAADLLSFLFTPFFVVIISRHIILPRHWLFRHFAYFSPRFRWCRHFRRHFRFLLPLSFSFFAFAFLIFLSLPPYFRCHWLSPSLLFISIFSLLMLIFFISPLTPL